MSSSYNFRPSTKAKTQVSEEEYNAYQSLLQQKREQKKQLPIQQNKSHQ